VFMRQAAHYNDAYIVRFLVGYEYYSNFKYDYKSNDTAGNDVDNTFLTDATACIVGFVLPLPAGCGLAGAYKYTDGASGTV
ncbi:porin, partial [Vibrio cholerae O1]|nr:porin [Vibrio cholerae O1]